MNDLTVYNQRPSVACRAAVNMTRRYFDMNPVQFMIGTLELDELTRDVDPPGKIPLELFEGVVIITNDDIYGCSLLVEEPLTDEISTIEIQWDFDFDEQY